MKDTKTNILNKAIELFNEKGVEYVGMREIAAALDTRIGNITYYFPTKDDLVQQITMDYTESNTAIREAAPVTDLTSFFALFDRLFRNQVRYRCLLLSFVHIIEHNAAVAAAYKGVRAKRTSSNEAVLRSLADGGYLKGGEEQLQTLARAFNLISRFWLSEAILSGHHRSKLDAQVAHYLRLLADLMKPHLTAKGNRQIAVVFGD